LIRINKMRNLLLILAVVMLSGCGGSEPTAPSPPVVAFSRTGTGNDAFDIPSSVKRLKVHGIYSGIAQNFIVWCNTQLLVNEILGSRGIGVTYDGTHQLQSTGCAMRIEQSTGVVWSVAQVQ
jgi:hypothetical protein